jgi:hypothetical protein
VRAADRIIGAKRLETTELGRSKGPVGWGGREEGLRLGGLRKPPVRAGRLNSDEDSIKLRAEWGYEDLALNPTGVSRKGRVDRATPRLEAGLGRTHCPEFGSALLVMLLAGLWYSGP